MNRRFAMLLVAALLLPQVVLAEPDYYYGDSAIYVGGKSSSSTPPVNILIFIDTSKQMGEIGTTGTYDPDEGPYSGTYSAGAIYYRNNDTYQVVSNTDLEEVETGYPDAYDLLTTNGNFIGCIDSKGEQCSNKTEDYYSGDYLNWKEGNVGTASEWAATTAYEVGDMVYKAGAGSDSRLYECIVDGTSGGSDPFPDSADLDATYTDGAVTWEPKESLIEAVAEELNNDIFPFLADEKGAQVGLMVYAGSPPQGGQITIGVDANTSAQLKTSMDTDIVPLPGQQTANAQPLGSALWDAWLYWVGDPTGTGPHANSTNNDNAEYSVSPIEYWCQNNHMIVLATGATKDNLGTSNPLRLMDDGDDYYAPEGAEYLHDSLDYDIDGVQSQVKTHVLQLLTPELNQLKDTASNGGGTYVHVDDVTKLKEALIDIVLAILEENSSFVAPVVPASPENRTYSGQRIYLGFFKPMNDDPWYGNLKKFGLNYDNQIVAFDGSGDLVAATDSDGYFLVDDSNDPATPLHRSYWTPSGTLDGGNVDAGGVGGLLKSRTSARNIYTYLGTESALTHSDNAFTTSNADLKNSLVGTDDTEKNELIHFIHGYEADGTTKRTWLLGDILHSKPLIVNYANYAFNETNEADSTKNKSMIFFGANDGMLHAINDYNGEEAWAFIPPELLDDLHYLKANQNHYYFVDNSPLAYVHDADGDGNIESGDKVVLIFGLRRGGGSSTLGTGSRGSYYALDISNPGQPVLLWQINNQTSGFGELGETWSQPRLAKMNIGGAKKIVAVFGAGYDNNEDLRYGNIQTFPDDTDGTTDTSAASDGYESAVSTGTSSQYQPKGRGLYVVEVAKLEEGTDGSGNPNGIYSPDFTDSGTKIWGAVWGSSNTTSSTEDTVSAMTYSIPSDVLVFDRDHDGYYDRFYVGDTGGQLWRFTVGDSSTANWTVKRIFAANNTSTTDVGRKIFYKPTVTYKYPDTFIYFGTGDREHPLNYLNPGTAGGAALDRFYMVRDRESDDNPNAPTAPLTESNLVDVTTNQLQRDDTSASDISVLLTRLFDFPTTGDSWNDRYGWFIKMNGNDGEKVLAPPTVFADIAFFTTYTPVPASASATISCAGGNLGTSRLYAVNARTGEAVYNWGPTEGTDEFGENQSSASSQRAQAGNDDGSFVLRRADRSLAIGEGIPSGLVTVISKDGTTSILIGSGGAFPNVALDQIETVYPLYWMTW